MGQTRQHPDVRARIPRLTWLWAFAQVSEGERHLLPGQLHCRHPELHVDPVDPDGVADVPVLKPVEFSAVLSGLERPLADEVVKEAVQRSECDVFLDDDVVHPLPVEKGYLLDHRGVVLAHSCGSMKTKEKTSRGRLLAAEIVGMPTRPLLQRSSS